MTKKYSWGVQPLDDLTGGIESTLIAVYGPTGSGKTTLSNIFPIGVISKVIIEALGEIPKEGKFIVIDGDGGFDLGRAKEVWTNLGLNAETIEEHLFYREVTDFDEQHKLICGRKKKDEEERESLEKIIEDNGFRPLLISLDPAVKDYRGIILRTDLAHRAQVLGTYTGRLDLQLSTIRHIAVTYDCPAIVSTWNSSPIGDAMRESEIRKLMREEKITREEAERSVPRQEQPFIGGRLFGYLPKLILGLSIPNEGEPLREVYLHKARGRPSGKKCFVYLSNKGISEGRD